MQLTETLNEALKREFKVSLPADQVAARIDAKLESLKDQVRLPGFRPGKVPMSLLKKRYAKGVLGEIADGLAQEALKELTDNRGLRPATQPQLDLDGDLDENGPINLLLSFEVLPDIPDVDFSKVSVEREVIEVEEKTVDEGLEDLRGYAQSLEPVDASKGAEDGNTVVIDFIGRIDGVAFDNGSGEGFPLKLGSGQFIPGFEDQLMGVKTGETRDVTVTFPEDYQASDLAGKEAVFEVTVKEVQEQVLPDLDDELAKKFGAESLEDLRTKMRDRLENDYAQVAFNRLKPRLLDALAPLCDFPVPETMLETEFANIWREVEAAIRNDSLDEEDKGKSEDELRADYREIALRRMRLGLLLAETGRKNGISVSQDELRQAMMQEMQRYPGQEQLIIDFYTKNQGAIEQLRAPIFEDKACRFILDQAQVTDKNVTIDDLKAEDEAEAASEKEKPKSKTKAKTKTAPKDKAEADSKDADDAPAKKATTKSKTAKAATGSDEAEAPKPKSRAKAKPKAE